MVIAKRGFKHRVHCVLVNSSRKEVLSVIGTGLRYQDPSESQSHPCADHTGLLQEHAQTAEDTVTPYRCSSTVFVFLDTTLQTLPSFLGSKKQRLIIFAYLSFYLGF